LEARRSFKCFSSLNFIIFAHVEVEKSRICHFWGSRPIKMRDFAFSLAVEENYEWK
jgi:hypothetical protein